MRDAKKMVEKNFFRENPQAKIAVSSFRLINRVMAKREAKRQEMGIILSSSQGMVKKKSVKAPLIVDPPFNNSLIKWVTEESRKRKVEEIRKDLVHSLKINFFNIIF